MAWGFDVIDIETCYRLDVPGIWCSWYTDLLWAGRYRDLV